MQWFFDLIGFGCCHQLDARSFVVDGFVYPLCARCTGIYLGLAFTLLFLAWFYRRARGTELPGTGPLIACIIGIGLMGADGASSWLGWRPTTNGIRFVTGFCCGASFGVYLHWAINHCRSLLASRCPARKGSARCLRCQGTQGLAVLGDPCDFVIWLLCAGSFCVLFLCFHPLLGVLGPLLVSLCIPSMFVLLGWLFLVVIDRPRAKVAPLLGDAVCRRLEPSRLLLSVLIAVLILGGLIVAKTLIYTHAGIPTPF